MNNQIKAVASHAELLPCPFCPDGGEPFLQRIGNEHTKERGSDVGCTGCGFTKHIRVIRYSCDWAEERALEAWNTRQAAIECITSMGEGEGTPLCSSADSPTNQQGAGKAPHGLEVVDGNLVLANLPPEIRERYRCKVGDSETLEKEARRSNESTITVLKQAAEAIEKQYIPSHPDDNHITTGRRLSFNEGLFAAIRTIDNELKRLGVV